MYQYIKILNVCVCLCVSVTEMGSLGGGTIVVILTILCTACAW